MENRLLSSEKVVYYQKTVPYVVGGRRFIGDPVGFVLTNTQPWVGVKETDIRDFKIANKPALINGLIIEVAEPSVDWDTTNAFSDEELEKFIGQPVAKVRTALEDITSISTLVRMLNLAKDKKKSDAMINAIETRLEDVNDEEINLEAVQRAIDA